MALLARREWSFAFGDGCNKWFVICEQSKGPALQEKAKRFNCLKSGKKFTIESRIAAFCRRKFVGKEGQRLSAAICFLL
jgi:hypothetical protein